MHSFITSLRLTIVTLLICVAGYTAALLGFAKTFAADTAEGSLIVVDGRAVGSRLIAQAFTRPDYFWPRPSAVDYDGAGAGGSNKSPTSPDLTERATRIVARYGATTETPLPAELAAASGCGLDPHITEHAAQYQARRVAAARHLPRTAVDSLISQHAFVAGGNLVPEPLVNVLELNLALDKLFPGG